MVEASKKHSETQLKVSENVNYLMRIKVEKCMRCKNSDFIENEEIYIRYILDTYFIIIFHCKIVNVMAIHSIQLHWK